MMTALGMVLLSCDSYTDSIDKRISQAEKETKEISIGVIGPLVMEGHFFDGISLAVDEINSQGGVLGRKLKTVVRDDTGSQSKAREIAREFSKNSNIVAVIGHSQGKTAPTASITYEFNGILFISLVDTSPALTNHGFKYVFRTTPSDIERSQQLAIFLQTKGLRKIVILHDEIERHRIIAYYIHAFNYNKEIQTIYQSSYYSGEKQYYSLLEELKGLEFDAIFLAGQMLDMATLIKQARELGITARFIGGDTLESPLLEKIAGNAAEGTIVTTDYNPKSKDKDTREFIKVFTKKYKNPPDKSAAKGYDAIKLLAFAIEKGKSSVPGNIAAMLHHTKNWDGVTGMHSFNLTGDILRKKIFFKKFQDGKFEFIRE
jgi:branched-chain amino acid transport system substrate-binding protein